MAGQQGNTRCEKTTATGGACGRPATHSVHPEDEAEVADVSPRGRGYWLACRAHAAEARQGYVRQGIHPRHHVRPLSAGEVRS